MSTDAGFTARCRHCGKRNKRIYRSGKNPDFLGCWECVVKYADAHPVDSRDASSSTGKA